MLWTRDYKLSTVHVYDVVRALWHLCYHGNIGDVYNVADKGDTSALFGYRTAIEYLILMRGHSVMYIVCCAAHVHGVVESVFLDLW